MNNENVFIDDKGIVYDAVDGDGSRSWCENCAFVRGGCVTSISCHKYIRKDGRSISWRKRPFPITFDFEAVAEAFVVIKSAAQRRVKLIRIYRSEMPA